jgi:asparagine synthase (glutamine-hydrolysing)
MCGIAGIFHRDGRPIHRESLMQIARAIAHRGPDSEGVYVYDRRPSVGLAARRLAIIDVENGDQPMSTEDGNYTIVYNGEIFNAPEVRSDLEAYGHHFRSRCDTEIVLRGYAQWGSDLLSRLNGMWAFAIWDRPRRRLFICRDRLGIKPIVYAETPDGCIFASEIKALFASGLVRREFNPEVLAHYLSAFVVPEPYSFFRGVRRLPAGHFLVVDATGAREFRYWDCGFEEEDDRGQTSCETDVRELVNDAVRRQLVSDVPLGVFLSAGTDSTLVAALAARTSNEALRTYTLGFEGSETDERAAARRTAASIGARHTDDVVTSREALARLPDLLAAHDEPSQSLIQGYFVSRLARREVAVALSGVGGDELFSSYPTHRVVYCLAMLDEIPSSLRGAVLAAAHLFGVSKAKRLVALMRMKPDERASRWLLHQTNGPTREALISPDIRNSVDLEGPARHLEQHYLRTRARHPLNRLLYVYLKTYLPDELLRTLDSMSMAHSLEARVPLLDHRLVEYAMRLPVHYKMSFINGKRLLRRVAAEITPFSSMSYLKRGFAVPTGAWLGQEMSESLWDMLCRPAVERRGVFDSSMVARLLKSCLRGDRRAIQPVMMLFTFELWARKVLDLPSKVADTPMPELYSVAPDLSVVIVNWNTREILKNCLGSIEKHLTAVNHEIIVVDNASSDGSAEMVANEYPSVRLIRNDENVGFARANNQAMRVARGQWFLLLNSDTLLIDDSVARLFARIRNENGLGIAHCQLVMADRRLQYSTYRFPSLKLAVLEDFGLYKLLPHAKRGKLLLTGYWNHDEERDVDWVAGSFMLLPRKVFEDTNGFSEKYFMYGEDMEWCDRIRRLGWRIRYYPQARIVHLDHASSALRWGDERIAICVRRQVDFYVGRHGRRMGQVYNFVKLTGMSLRFASFSLRSALNGRANRYDRDMKRYYLRCLRVHALLSLGER